GLRTLDGLPKDASWGSEGVLRDEEALCLDPTFYGNVGRFVNHRCYDANLVIIPVEVETPDRHYYHLALFTAKKIEAFEELTRDYGIDFDGTDDLNKAFDCMCGSKYCRGGGPKNSRKRTRASASRN
uniref:SET domain-containing protein n=1 Tax=Aegilops tauschii subsp. strangulata TaxID=200361 RepID=A0A453CI06_AEGTS